MCEDTVYFEISELPLLTFNYCTTVPADTKQPPFFATGALLISRKLPAAKFKTTKHIEETAETTKELKQLPFIEQPTENHAKQISICSQLQNRTFARIFVQLNTIGKGCKLHQPLKSDG